MEDEVKRKSSHRDTRENRRYTLHRKLKDIAIIDSYSKRILLSHTQSIETFEQAFSIAELIRDYGYTMERHHPDHVTLFAQDQKNHHRL